VTVEAKPTLQLDLLADDPMGGPPWALYSVEFYVPDRAMAQSAYLYARSFADAQTRVRALATGASEIRQLHSTKPL
jgi:hypothetical protein